MKNGTATYSKTPFKETKHKRGPGGTFETKASTDKDDVEYHHDFASKDHPRKSDGSFNSYGSSKREEDSDALKNGKSRYGR